MIISPSCVSVKLTYIPTTERSFQFQVHSESSNDIHTNDDLSSSNAGFSTN